jgi:hypothetical protein
MEHLSTVSEEQKIGILDEQSWIRQFHFPTIVAKNNFELVPFKFGEHCQVPIDGQKQQKKRKTKGKATMAERLKAHHQQQSASSTFRSGTFGVDQQNWLADRDEEVPQLRSQHCHRRSRILFTSEQVILIKQKLFLI